MDLKKVFVTGSTGFVGACLTYKLIDLHYDVHLAIRQESNLWRIKNIIGKVNLHYLDLTDVNSLEKLIHSIKPNLIYHLAAYGVYPFQNDLKKIIQTNIMGTINLVDACSKIGFDCFINTGSSSEYGLKSKSMEEEDILKPINNYGFSKAAATLYCQMVAKRERLPIVTLRLFSPYGYYENRCRLIPTVILSCLSEKNPKLSSPEAVRDFIFIEDVIEAYLKVIEVPDIGGEIFNIGCGNQRSVGEVVNKIIKLMGNNVRPEWGKVSNPRFEPKVWQANISKTKSILKREPNYNLEEGLNKTIEWFEKNLSLYKGGIDQEVKL